MQIHRSRKPAARPTPNGESYQRLSKHVQSKTLLHQIALLSLLSSVTNAGRVFILTAPQPAHSQFYRLRKP